MTIGEELVYIVNVAGTIYGIEGITNSSIVKYDLFNKKVENFLTCQMKMQGLYTN